MTTSLKSKPVKDESIQRAEKRFRAYRSRAEKIAISRKALVREMWYEKPFKHWFSARRSSS